MRTASPTATGIPNPKRIDPAAFQRSGRRDILRPTMRRGIRASLPALAVALALAGCAAPRGAQLPPGHPTASSASTALSPDLGESPYRRIDGLAEGTILHVPTGVEVTRVQLFDLLAGARVIYVGESHTNVRHHRIQLDILTALADRFPGKVAVGME